MFVVTFDNEIKYGLVIGDEKFLLVNPDFTHWTIPNDRAFPLTVGYSTTEGEKDPEGFTALTIADVEIETTLDKLLVDAVEMPIKKFATYWGIKDRVYRNYILLQQSMQKIGVNPNGLPTWGEK